MLSTESTEILETKISDLMIPSEKVAHVQNQNPLEHALLVLVKTGYSAVPVLDANFHFEGIVSKTMIIESILGIERIEVEKLSKITVSFVMEKDVPTIRKDDTFMKGLKLVINRPFVCVVDESGYFDGILTRRVILKQMNRYLHENNKKDTE
ncbi:cyclic-di-AMP-binding protein CbpB [Salinibacillus xinjiangensis]|uniref:CBS domain-containing protein n=1 Tax=Salinibacillus xinjiangensis TaxID=1229268 RepID=A0A6G1X3Q6_9BACI|nr:cyclic-di-AMP-binding protein CbpB [Salinibacillus xinjiangensis]MRG85577.1 CBS domain-containing protein [Salinibacillus xinjiangensis]